MTTITEALTTTKTVEASDFYEAQRIAVADRYPEPEGHWLTGVTVALLLENGRPVWFRSGLGARSPLRTYFLVTLHWTPGTAH
jgi:hypothetical protein